MLVFLRVQSSRVQWCALVLVSVCCLHLAGCGAAGETIGASQQAAVLGEDLGGDGPSSADEEPALGSAAVHDDWHAMAEPRQATATSCVDVTDLGVSEDCAACVAELES